jgi:synaptobrevin family protein YKT6
MRILSIKYFNTNIEGPPVLLTHAEDLSTLPFLARMTGSAGELLLFISRTFVERTERGKCEGCRDGEYIGWIYHKHNGIAGVVICDQEYDRRVALTLIHKYMNIYENKTVNWDWETYNKDNSKIDDELQNLLIRFQSPKDQDTITKINKDLEETRVTLHESIDKMLDRGTKIDTLVDKSDDLSRQSKIFYKKSKKLNNWCGSCIIS